MNKENVRFTFDCPKSLHMVAKMKAARNGQSIREYVLALMAKDTMEDQPQFVDDDTFNRAMKRVLEKDAELMRKLSER